MNASKHQPLALLGAYKDLGTLSLPIARSLVLNLFDAFELVREKSESLPWVASLWLVLRIAKALALEFAIVRHCWTLQILRGGFSSSGFLIMEHSK